MAAVPQPSRRRKPADGSAPTDRRTDIMQHDMARVSTSTMGEAIVRELDKEAA